MITLPGRIISALFKSIFLFKPLIPDCPPFNPYGASIRLSVCNDTVELTNLHRTSIFNEEDIGSFKCQVLEEKLQKINSEVKIKGIQKRVTKENIESIVKNADIILDDTDNMQTRFLINDVSIKNGIPWIYAGVYSTVGMVMGIIPKQTPCLKCISQSIPEKNLVIPVLGNLPITTDSIE